MPSRSAAAAGGARSGLWWTAGCGRAPCRSRPAACRRSPAPRRTSAAGRGCAAPLGRPASRFARHVRQVPTAGLGGVADVAHRRAKATCVPHRCSPAFVTFGRSGRHQSRWRVCSPSARLARRHPRHRPSARMRVGRTRRHLDRSYLTGRHEYQLVSTPGNNHFRCDVLLADAGGIQAKLHFAYLAARPC
jgi:hypothetical protein